MILTIIFQVVLIIILVFLSGFFSASEIAIVAVRSSRLKKLVAENNKKAIFVDKLKSNPDDFFAIVQIGITVTLSAASAIGTSLAITIIGPLIGKIPIQSIQTASEAISLTLVVLLISYLFLVLAELVPKAMAIRKSESIALWVGPPTWYALKMFLIIIRVLTSSTNLCLKLMGFSSKDKSESTVSEEEIQLIIKDGYEKGIFDKEERLLIKSIFEFTDTTVKRAMTPRTDIVAFDINSTSEQLLKGATEERFSRFPIYEENLDNIKGIIHSRDLLYVYKHKDLFILKDIIRPVNFVPDSKKISELLREMQKDKSQMAIVLDEFGGTDGIITMEDVIEEIVGDIQDEYDKEASKIEFVDKNKARVIASMPIDEFANEFGVKIDEGDFETVGGMIAKKLGRIPAKNEVINFGEFNVKIIEKENNRIKLILASKPKRGNKTE